MSNVMTCVAEYSSEMNLPETPMYGSISLPSTISFSISSSVSDPVAEGLGNFAVLVMPAIYQW